MLLDFSDGFKFVLGWLMGKFVFNFAMIFVDQILCDVWPAYRKIKDDYDWKRHPWRYSTHEE